VSPLFATLGLRIANQETFRLWEGYAKTDPTSMFGAHGFYVAVNRYVYGGFHLGPKQTWQVMKMSFSQLGPVLRNSVARRSAGRDVLAGVVADWEQKDLSSISPGELLEGVRVLFRAAVKYFTVIQTTLPAASIAEILYGRYYNALVRRKGDPEYTALLFGYETAALRAEKSLFDIAAWLREVPGLAGYVERTSTEQLAADWHRRVTPAGLPEEGWTEWCARIDEHFEQFGRTAYEFDFANPTPAESPAPQFEAVRQFLLGKATNPYERHQAAAERREQAEQAILKRLGWPVKDRFIKLLREAQATAPVREDSITDLGMAHPLIRRMLAELGARLAAAGVIQAAEDIYWLEEAEVEAAVANLERGERAPSLAEVIPTRKAEWRAALRATPPLALPENSFWLRFFAGSGPKQKNGQTVLKGLGTSGGTVTAPACVLNGPEDFGAMRPGDVLVATTTTPAWTPLFAMASAVVTDIGGPLSHSSIVAREYGIPAVMGARDATRTIRSGQRVVVDGKAGTVTLL
ncbi:MAG TPA: PEP-utilizing enzyme, partial [Anaerolinea sp.]|nr:PEP-utilizing enzyme [Anaerolinea sp.]